MRARIFLIGGTIGLVGFASIVQACGGTESVAADPDLDSGVGEVADSAQEAAPAADDDAATCDLSADFSTKIPDAALADGMSSTGLCVQCGKVECATQVAACNQDCPCQGIAAEALDCYLKNSANPLVCAGSFLGVDAKTRQLGLAVLGCLNSECADECATEAFQDGGSDADADPT